MSRHMYFDTVKNRKDWFEKNILNKICPANCRMNQFNGGHYYSEHQSLVAAIYNVNPKDFDYPEDSFVHPIYNKSKDKLIYGFEVVKRYEHDVMLYQFTDSELHQINIASVNMKRRITDFDEEAIFLS